MYFLITCKKIKKKFIYHNSKCLYTSKNFDNNMDFDSNITNSYNTHIDIYKTNFSLQELYTY